MIKNNQKQPKTTKNNQKQSVYPLKLSTFR